MYIIVYDNFVFHSTQTFGAAMRAAADRMRVKAVKRRRQSRSSTMAANFHSDSILAVSASVRILSAMTVISCLMPFNSSSRPPGGSGDSPVSGGRTGLAGVTGRLARKLDLLQSFSQAMAS